MALFKAKQNFYSQWQTAFLVIIMLVSITAFFGLGHYFFASDHDYNRLNTLSLDQYYSYVEHANDTATSFGNRMAFPESAYALSDVNFRNQPSAQSRVLSVILTGDRVKLLQERSGVWYKVRFDRQTGWVSGKFLKPIVTVSERMGVVGGVGARVLTGIFPESTLLEKFVGWIATSIVTILLCIVLRGILGKYYTFRFIGQDWKVSDLALIIPGGVFLAKTGIWIELPMHEFGSYVWLYGLGALIASLPAACVSRMVIREL